MKHPFIYGRPVKGSEFIGRTSELSTIFNRLCNGESSAVVGEPHIGKTSLLLQITNSSVQEYFLGSDCKRFTFSFIDLLPIDNSFNRSIFWERVLEPLVKHPKNAAITKKLKDTSEADYGDRALERLFERLADDDRCLVLLLDEFDHLLKHPNFHDASFFALLRSLSTHVGGLSYITATRISVAQMNESGRGLLDAGSPFFNHVIPVILKPFNQDDVRTLLGRAENSFSTSDIVYITRLAGRHPFLLQAMAATLLEGVSVDRMVQAGENFYERVSSHFDDLWYAMDDHTRTVAVILSIMELGGMALGKEFAYGEIEQIQAFGPELRKLAESGLAERVREGWQFDWEHLLLWQGEKWAIGPQVFTWWVRDTVIAGERKVPTYNDWLKRKGYKVLLTEEQWETLQRATQALPKWITQGAALFIRTLVESYWMKS